MMQVPLDEDLRNLSQGVDQQGAQSLMLVQLCRDVERLQKKMEDLAVPASSKTSQPVELDFVTRS